MSIIRRLLACKKACEKIDTETLEHESLYMIVGGVIDRNKALQASLDALVLRFGVEGVKEWDEARKLATPIKL